MHGTLAMHKMVMTTDGWGVKIDPNIAVDSDGWVLINDANIGHLSHRIDQDLQALMQDIAEIAGERSDELRSRFWSVLNDVRTEMLLRCAHGDIHRRAARLRTDAARSRRQAGADELEDAIKACAKLYPTHASRPRGLQFCDKVRQYLRQAGNQKTYSDDHIGRKAAGILTKCRR